MKTTKIVTALLISTLVSACSMNSTKPAQPQANKQTPADILRSQGSKSKQSESFRKANSVTQSPVQQTADNSVYTRTEARELKGLFPRLPNPDICMYVFPHLSSENATIPGYTSCFSMYEKNHYALPGETMTLWQAQ